MIKYLVLLFNLIGLFLYQLFFQTNVTATQSVPASADAGSSFVVEVSINKADISGFAKYQEDLPKGFTAVAVDKQGATVLSSDNAIKFIWASLPSDATVKISFRITVDASVSGAQPLSGKFLYVVNNERQEADVAASNITINSTAPASVATNTVTATPADTQPAATTTDNSSQPATTNSTPATTTTTDNSTQPAANNTTTTTAPVDNTTAPANNTSNTTTPPIIATAPGITVSGSRSLSATSVEAASDITVSVTIHKSTLIGFAKLEETLPNGVIAAEGDKQGASFTFVDNKVKFVWLSLPTDSVFTVSYKLTPGSTVSGDQSVTGEFSYLLDNNSAKYVVPSTTFTVKNAALTNTTQPATTNPPVTTTTAPDNSQPATTNPPVTTTTAPDNSQPATTNPPVTTTTAPDNTQPATTNPPVTTTTAPDNSQPATTNPPVTTTTAPDNSQPATTNPPVTTTTPPVADMTSVVTPHVSGANGGVMYRVQIMALHNAVKPSYLSGKFRISETINEEMIEGYTKYTVGKFDEYKSTRDHREEIRSKGVAGPFVVAYNDGKRITVQEALMITHQQWYK